MKIWPFPSRDPNVAVLRLSGVISPSGRPFSGSLNLANLAAPIQEAFSLRGVKAVALSINSPGGSPVQSALIARRVRSLAREKERPVFAFIEDIAASGGSGLLAQLTRFSPNRAQSLARLAWCQPDSDFRMR